MDRAGLDAAIAYHLAHENAWPRSFITASGRYAARGAGSNVIWIDPEHDLVVVVRWIDKASIAGFLELVVKSVER